MKQHSFDNRVFLSLAPIENGAHACMTILLSNDSSFQTGRNTISQRFLLNYIINSIKKKCRLNGYLKTIEGHEYGGLQLTLLASNIGDQINFILDEILDMNLELDVFEETKKELMCAHNRKDESQFLNLIRQGLNYYLPDRKNLPNRKELLDTFISFSIDDFKASYRRFVCQESPLYISIVGGFKPDTIISAMERGCVPIRATTDQGVCDSKSKEKTSIMVKKPDRKKYINRIFSYISYPASRSIDIKGQWCQRILRDYLTSIDGPFYNMSRNNYENINSCCYVLSAHSAKLSTLGAFIVFWRSDSAIEEKAIYSDVTSLFGSIENNGIPHEVFSASKERVKLKFIKKRTRIESASHFIADNMYLGIPLTYRIDFQKDLDTITHAEFQSHIKKLVAFKNQRQFFKYTEMEDV